MGDRSVNFLWLNSELPDSPNYGRIPDVLVNNVLNTHNLNPNENFSFWHNPDQWSIAGQKQLQILQNDGFNLYDIKTYPEFNECNLFSQEIKKEKDRLLKWRQIDLAKVMISSITLPNFEQTFFSDMDIKDLKVESPEVQKPMLKHGLIVGVGKSLSNLNFENQFFGFDKRNKEFLDYLLMKTTIITTIADGDNGYQTLLHALLRHKKDILNDIGYIPHYCSNI